MQCRSERKRILDDPDPPAAVDEGNVEGNLGILPARFIREKCAGRRDDASELTRRQPLGGDSVGFGALHLDEDEAGAVPRDEVDLAAGAPPAPGRDLHPALQVPRLDLRLGDAARVICDSPPQPSSASRSAIW